MTPDAKGRGPEIPTRTGTNRGVLLAVVLSSAIVGGVVGWTIRAVTEPDSPSVGHEQVVDLVDDFFAAFNGHDSEGMETLLADDYAFSETMFDPAFPFPLEGDDTRQELVSRLDTIYPRVEFQKEPIGEPAIVGEGPWIVSQRTLTTSTDPNLTDLEGVTTLVVVDDGGQLKVRLERLVGLFPNAAS